MLYTSVELILQVCYVVSVTNRVKTDKINIAVKKLI